MSAQPARTAAAPAIRAESLSKRFRADPQGPGSLKTFLNPRLPFTAGDITALEGVSFELAPGETLGLIGENGAGKSTLLRILAGISDPSGGSVEIRGRIASLLSLDAGFHPDLTGRDNFGRQCALLGLSDARMREIFPDVLAFSELGPAIDRPLKTYSAGMRVRLGFSLATRLDADILLFDEILLVGDENFQRKCVAHLRELRERKAPVIVLASHDLGLIRSFCDRTLWLDKGKLREIGESWAVAQGYQEWMRAKSGVRAGELQPAAETPPIDPDGAGRPTELEILDAELLDPEGRPTTRALPGQTLTLRVHYEARGRVPAPNFGIALYRSDGVLVYGTSSAKDGAGPAEVPVGKGSFELSLPDLALLPGAYEITLACFDAADQYKYDYQHRRWRFEIGRGGREDGLVRLAHEWKF